MEQQRRDMANRGSAPIRDMRTSDVFTKLHRVGGIRGPERGKECEAEVEVRSRILNGFKCQTNPLSMTENHCIHNGVQACLSLPLAS